MSAEDEVRQASTQFYAALTRMLNGDAGPMMEVWAQSPDVTAMHPVPGRLVGWEQVRGAWEQFASQFRVRQKITLSKSSVGVSLRDG